MIEITLVRTELPPDANFTSLPTIFNLSCPR